MHPLLQPFPTLDKACSMMESNLEQVMTYLETYCQETRQSWCDLEVE
jgi:hypothetical protein